LPRDKDKVVLAGALASNISSTQESKEVGGAQEGPTTSKKNPLLSNFPFWLTFNLGLSAESRLPG